jgi:nitrous oxidase accessory protein NosD
LLFVFFALARPAHATVAVELGGPELAALSDVIVHARVVALGGHVQLNPLRVFTDADLEVIEGIKGASAGDRVHVSYPGGVHNGLGMFVSGQVALSANQECVIYLKRATSGAFIPAAMRQGFFAVTKRDYDGVRLGVKNTAGIALLQRGGGMQRLNETPKQLVRPLGDVLTDIRADLKLAAKIDRQTLMGAR